MPPKAVAVSRSTGGTRTVVAARTSGGRAFRSGGFHRPISYSSPSRFVSVSGVSGYGYPYYRNRYYDNFVYYPYPYPVYSYATVPYPVTPIITNYTVANPLTAFGTCQGVDGVGVVQNACAPGLVAIPQAGNTCTCYDRTTGSSGCSNVAGATCAPITPYPFL